jgi:hypothetical protein
MSDPISSAERTQPFTMIYNVVIDQYQLNPYELALYTAIARHINHATGLAWPSYTRLRELTGQARATISKYLQSLERKHLIQITRRRKAGTKARAANLYQLLDPSQLIGHQLPLEEVSADPDIQEEADPSDVLRRGSSRPEPQVVHEVNQASSRGERQVVHAADRNKTESNETRSNQIDLNQKGPARSAGIGAHRDADAQNNSAPKTGAALQENAHVLKEKDSWNNFCRTLADLCQLDFSANQGKIRRFASKLWRHGQGYTTADLKAFEAWWYNHDWRGKKGDIPRLDEVTQMIRVAVEEQQKALQSEVTQRYRYISGELAAYINY